MILGFIPKELLTALFLVALSQALNILSGTIQAERKGTFDWNTFKNGVLKALLFLAVMIGVALAATIDTTLEFDGTPILTYIITALKVAYVYYFGQSVIKALKMISIPSEGE